MSNENRNYDTQKHVHELTGSTAVVSECNECHKHRFQAATLIDSPTDFSCCK